MAFDDVLDDRQPEPGAAGGAAAAGIGAVEAPGKVRDVLGGDAFAAVAHGQHRHLALAALDADRDAGLRRAVLERVVDEVAYELLELLAVAEDDELLARLDEVEPLLPLRPGAVAGRLRHER